MIKKVDLGSSSHHGVFGNPAPLGLLGLAVSCAAITPIAFGMIKGEEMSSALLTAGIFVLFFGFGTHLITGIMDFANKNAYGGTIFTAFAFNWMVSAITYFAIAFNYPVNHTVILATEVILMAVFVWLTYGFGFFSTALFLFLFDIDLLFACKLIKGFAHTAALDIPIALFTVFLGLIGLWLALAGLINPITGKDFFPVGKPVFLAPKKKGFSFSVRRSIFDNLYNQWKEHAFQGMTQEVLEKNVKSAAGTENILPDLYYLMEYGSIHMDFEEDEKKTIKSIRLTAAGIDLYEQLIFKKYEF